VRERLFAADARASARLAQRAARPGLLRAAAIVLAHSGDSPLWLAAVLLALWLGSAFWRREAQIGLAGIALTAAVVQLLKLTVRRPRPEGQWGQGYRKLDPHSFPSGHAARAAALAALALWLGPLWWAAVLVIWAPLVSLARVVMGVHYLSDVAVGAAVGLLCAGVLVAISAGVGAF